MWSIKPKYFACPDCKIENRNEQGFVRFIEVSRRDAGRALERDRNSFPTAPPKRCGLGFAPAIWRSRARRSWALKTFRSRTIIAFELLRGVAYGATARPPRPSGRDAIPCRGAL
jgi:hypothetical protein